jgi:hypothetical protein
VNGDAATGGWLVQRLAMQNPHVAAWLTQQTEVEEPMSENVSPERIERTLAALDAWWLQYASPPTLRQLTATLGLTAYSTVHQALHVALAQGLVWSPDTAPAHTIFVPLWVIAALRVPDAPCYCCLESGCQAGCRCNTKGEETK